MPAVFSIFKGTEILEYCQTRVAQSRLSSRMISGNPTRILDHYPYRFQRSGGRRLCSEIPRRLPYHVLDWKAESDRPFQMSPREFWFTSSILIHASSSGSLALAIADTPTAK